MPATATPPERLLHPEPEEHDGFVALGAVLAAAANRQATTCVLGPNGENIELPATAFEALRTVVEAMANGQTVTLVPHHHELTTQQAADLLRISRPSLIKLLENDALPFRRVGTHRRVRIEDVLAYRETRAQQRRRELDELTALSEDLGYR